MKDYNFKNLAEDLEIGHEIEFKYRDDSYGIVNFDGEWMLVKNNKTESSCEFEDRKRLIEIVSTYKLNGITIKEFFNSDMEIKDLYIL